MWKFREMYFGSLLEGVGEKKQRKQDWIFSWERKRQLRQDRSLRFSIWCKEPSPLSWPAHRAWTVIFNTVHYHGPFGVLFSAGGVIVRILLIKLCVIRVCLLYDLKHKGRRKFPPVQNTCQPRAWDVTRNNPGAKFSLAFPELHSDSFLYISWVEEVQNRECSITCWRSVWKDMEQRKTGELMMVFVMSSPLKAVLCPGFIPLPCGLCWLEWSESGWNQCGTALGLAGSALKCQQENSTAWFHLSGDTWLSQPCSVELRCPGLIPCSHWTTPALFGAETQAMSCLIAHSSSLLSPKHSPWQGPQCQALCSYCGRRRPAARVSWISGNSLPVRSKQETFSSFHQALRASL